MIVLILLAFVGMLTGIFLILGMTPFTFAEELTKPLSGRRQPISKRIQQVNHPKEPKGIRKTVQEAREMLILTGKGGKFAAVCAFSLFLAAMGAVICIVIQNYFMLPVLAAGMGLLPFWYVLFTSHSYKKLMNNEIETGLSIITSSYLRSESMITAVEENIHYLNPPVADVFRGFLAETNMISADVKQALSNMKPKLDNYVFREWVDAAIACQDDKSLKSTLTPIIGKLSDMRIVAAELDYLLYEPFKEFITMAFLLIGNIPLLYFLNMQRAFSSELKPRARLVLQVLVLHCNKEGECFPSIKTIAAKCGYGVSTVKRALDELVKAGYIVKQARFDERKNGGQTSNLYTLCSDLPCPDEPENVPVPEDDASDESPAVQPESAPADTCDAPDPTPGEQSATLPTADSYSFADGFETKIGRQNCRPIRMWTGGQSIFIPP